MVAEIGHAAGRGSGAARDRRSKALVPQRTAADRIAKHLPIASRFFETLAETSELADAVIARAYDAAIAEVRATHPPEGRFVSTRQIRCGPSRLGAAGHGATFDLASDADLVFVLADSDSGEMRFWTRRSGSG